MATDRYMAQESESGMLVISSADGAVKAYNGRVTDIFRMTPGAMPTELSMPFFQTSLFKSISSADGNTLDSNDNPFLLVRDKKITVECDVKINDSDFTLRIKPLKTAEGQTPAIVAIITPKPTKQ